MTRFDRLYALTELLRSGRPTRVPELAQRFGVSERTIARDLAFLRTHDLPIEGTPGPRGGLRLLTADARDPALDLSDEEIATLWLSVWTTASRAPADAGVAHAALTKVERALASDQRALLRALARRVLIGRAASEELAEASIMPRPGVVAALARAFATGTAVEMHYEDKTGTRTRRVIEPQALLAQVPVWYLLAYDRTREAPRTFRVDRIRRALALPDPISQRLDLAQAFNLAIAGVRPR